MQPNLTSTQELAAPIAGYFAHEATDPVAVARCFTEDAVVADERREHRGRAAIAAWNAAAVANYGMKTEVLAAQTDGPCTTVRVKVTGTFPGSPASLQFRFTLADDLIARLEIS